VNPFRGMTEFGEGITFTVFFIGLGLIPFLIFKIFKTNRKLKKASH
jgi:hypothetical protein